MVHQSARVWRPGADAFPLIAISDTHLGVPYSMLHAPESREAFLDALTRSVGRKRIGTLVLLGDIPELSQLPDEEAFAAVREFLTDLLTRCEVGGIILIPGNHDYQLWRWASQDAFPAAQSCLAALNLRGGLLESPLPTHDFGGLLHKLVPSDVQPETPVSVAYPDLLVGAGTDSDVRWTLLHHGHLVKKSFVSGDFFTKWQRAGLVSYAKYRYPLARNVNEPWKAQTLADLQVRTQPLLETIFYPKQGGLAPPDSGVVHTLYLHQRQKRAHRDPLGRLSPDFVRSKYTDEILHYLYCGDYLGLVRDGRLQFVFGDSHDGGVALASPLAATGALSRATIDLYNTGSWLATGKAVPPRSFVFRLDEDGSAGIELMAFPPEQVEAARRRGLEWLNVSGRSWASALTPGLATVEAVAFEEE